MSRLSASRERKDVLLELVSRDIKEVGEPTLLVPDIMCVFVLAICECSEQCWLGRLSRSLGAACEGAAS